MSKRKGVTAEEKRNRILQLFHERKDFFQLKELEKIAPKEKGVVAQSVKDVVQSLVDDGLVDTDKIGSSTYFWAYPSKALNLKKRKLEETEELINQFTTKCNDVKEKLYKVKMSKGDSEDREDILLKLDELKKKKSKLEVDLKKHQKYDPKILEKLENDIKVKKEAVNKWTDNIYAVKSWCKNKFMIEPDIIDKQFGIPSELEYVE
ncbi:hypothetical protein RUM43_001967 [Polyplax serrata]|uniref:Meiotic nuclear division protein 1 homolog n=1 Tax=Polyplax serrata TaxID=468196 RepID=A0AAN8NTU5_POLSC